MPNRRLTRYAGVDIGGTGIKAAIIDAQGSVLGRAKRPTNADRGTPSILDGVREALQDACHEAEFDLRDVAALGAGVAGPVDTARGQVISAVNLGWERFPLAEALTGEFHVPVFVENDVGAAVWGEKILGGGRGETELLGVWVGTGIGGGLILNDRLYKGGHGTAGEVGRGVVFPWAPPGQGTLDHVCSRKGIVDTLTRLIRSGRESMIEEMVGGDLEKIGARELARAWRKRDPLVNEVVRHAAAVLGTSIGGMVTFLSLGRVVLGGGLTHRLGRRWVSLVQRAARRTVFPDTLQQVDVVESELADDAGPVGAALLAVASQDHSERAPASANGKRVGWVTKR